MSQPNQPPAPPSTVSPEQLAQALEALAGAGTRAEALVEEWVKQQNAAGVAVAAERATGAARKTARRGVGVLKARGVAVPRVVSGAQSAALAEETAPVRAWLLPPDNEGTSILALVREPRASLCDACILLVNAAKGVLDLRVERLGGVAFHEELRRLGRNEKLRPVAVPVDWARARIAEVRARAAAAGFAEPLQLAAAAHLVEPVPPPQPHPFDEEGLEVTDEDAEMVGADHDRLGRLPEFEAWMAPYTLVGELAREAHARLDALEEKTPEREQAIVKSVIEEATDRFFPPQALEQLIGMMKDCGLSILQREGETAALELAATIKLIRQCGLITNTPSQNAFLVGFVTKALEAFAAEHPSAAIRRLMDALPSKSAPSA